MERIKVAEGLSRAGIRAEAIHGNKSQNARQRALAEFQGTAYRVLVRNGISPRGASTSMNSRTSSISNCPMSPRTLCAPDRAEQVVRAPAESPCPFAMRKKKNFLRDYPEADLQSQYRYRKIILTSCTPACQQATCDYFEGEPGNGRSSGNSGNEGAVEIPAVPGTIGRPAEQSGVAWVPAINAMAGPNGRQCSRPDISKDHPSSASQSANQKLISILRIRPETPEFKWEYPYPDQDSGEERWSGLER